MKSPAGAGRIPFPLQPPKSAAGETPGMKSTPTPVNTINPPTTSGMKIESMSRHSVFCITASPIQAAKTVDRLKTARFPDDAISALLADPKMNWPFTNGKRQQASETPIAGASTGTVLGDTCGWIAGIGALTIPGVGLFIAAGPIIAAMSGASTGKALGGVCDGLIGMGIPETKAKGYESKILKGEILLSVHTETRGDMDRAKDIFDDSRADDIWANDTPADFPGDTVQPEPPANTRASASDLDNPPA